MRLAAGPQLAGFRHDHYSPETPWQQFTVRSVTILKSATRRKSNNQDTNFPAAWASLDLHIILEKHRERELTPTK